MAKCNTVTFTARDGKVVSFPLQWLIDKGAIIANKVNGADIMESMGAYNQLWIPGYPAKYYIRDIVDIKFTNEEVPPELPVLEDDGHDYTNRPNVAVKGEFVGRVGETMSFEGWANDYDKAITGIQVSLDGGASWRDCETPGAVAERLLFWRFDYTPKEPGSYQLRARAVNEDGKVSPTPAVHSFEVVE